MCRCWFGPGHIWFTLTFGRKIECRPKFVQEIELSIESILAEIDSEIDRLQEVRLLLNGETIKKGPGRPRTKVAVAVSTAKPKRTMSAVARANIAAAQKARWARARKTADKKVTVAKPATGK
jgi:hypothetical protein